MRRTRPVYVFALLAGVCVTAGGCSQTSPLQPFAMAQFSRSMNASDGVGAGMPRSGPVANVSEKDTGVGGR